MAGRQAYFRIILILFILGIILPTIAAQDNDNSASDPTLNVMLIVDNSNGRRANDRGSDDEHHRYAAADQLINQLGIYRGQQAALGNPITINVSVLLFDTHTRSLFDDPWISLDADTPWDWTSSTLRRDIKNKFTIAEASSATLNEPVNYQSVFNVAANTYEALEPTGADIEESAIFIITATVPDGNSTNQWIVNMDAVSNSDAYRSLRNNNWKINTIAYYPMPPHDNNPVWSTHQSEIAQAWQEVSDTKMQLSSPALLAETLRDSIDDIIYGAYFYVESDQLDLNQSPQSDTNGVFTYKIPPLQQSLSFTVYNQTDDFTVRINGEAYTPTSTDVDVYKTAYTQSWVFKHPPAGELHITTGNTAATVSLDTLRANLELTVTDADKYRAATIQLRATDAEGKPVDSDLLDGNTIDVSPISDTSSQAYPLVKVSPGVWQAQFTAIAPGNYQVTAAIKAESTTFSPPPVDFTIHDINITVEGRNNDESQGEHLEKEGSITVLQDSQRRYTVSFTDKDEQPIADITIQEFRLKLIDESNFTDCRANTAIDEDLSVNAAVIAGRMHQEAGQYRLCLSLSIIDPLDNTLSYPVNEPIGGITVKTVHHLGIYLSQPIELSPSRTETGHYTSETIRGDLFHFQPPEQQEPISLRVSVLKKSDVDRGNPTPGSEAEAIHTALTALAAETNQSSALDLFIVADNDWSWEEPLVLRQTGTPGVYDLALPELPTGTYTITIEAPTERQIGEAYRFDNDLSLLTLEIIVKENTTNALIANSIGVGISLVIAAFITRPLQRVLVWRKRKRYPAKGKLLITRIATVPRGDEQVQANIDLDKYHSSYIDLLPPDDIPATEPEMLSLLITCNKELYKMDAVDIAYNVNGEPGSHTQIEPGQRRLIYRDIQSPQKYEYYVVKQARKD